MSSSQGILFLRNENEEFKWFEHGDEDKDGKYVGGIEYGEPNGQGTFTSSAGDKYVGKFKDGKKHGKGAFTWSDGEKYVGKFKDGECHGQGTFTSKDGEKFVGEWKDDDEWNITGYDKNGNITGKWVNGVEQK